MPDKPVIAIHTVWHTGADDAERVEVGSVAYRADGRLDIIAAEPEHEKLLHDAIRSVNAKDRIIELVAPTTDDLATDTIVTERDDETFADALSRYLDRYYGFALS